MQHTPIFQLEQAILPYKQQIVHHPLYQSINTIQHLQQFAGYHVFAVWDFMSLLKSLQIQLTSVSIPWLPKGTANTRYLINEIVTGEESDEDENGNRASHFELYLQAMEQMGANTALIQQFLLYLQQGVPIAKAMQQLQVPLAIQEFVGYTFHTIQTAPIHVQAAVFTFGREDLIPSMFIELVNQLSAANQHQLSKFSYYLNRHIELDGDHHSKLAINMVAELCGNDAKKWKEATLGAQKSLEKRLILWDAIYRQTQVMQMQTAI
ncbi:MAG: DUF3050 domain-containing protein [Chitinophagaceae bacterium]